MAASAHAAPTVTLTATPSAIVLGASAQLTWSSTGATSCSAGGSWSGAVATSGSQAVTPTRTGSFRYSLSCRGASGTARTSATVAVGAPLPAITIAANPATIVAGGSATIAWTVGNATSCQASGAWSGSQSATGGSVVVSPAAAGSYTYTLACTGTGGSASKSAALTVTAAGAPAATLSPTSLVFPGQATGTTSAAQTVALTNSGTATLANIAITLSGDFAQATTCAATLAAKAGCAINVSFAPTATGARSGVLTVTSNAAGGAATAALGGTGTAPSTSTAMALISTGAPIAASSAQYPASAANDADYNTEWRSNGVPATLALDLSKVPTAQRQSIDLAWYNEDSYGYDHTLIGQPGYNNAGAYTIEVNAAAGGGAAPTTGWVTVASLAGNHLRSYSYNLPFAGYNWIRGNFTASDGSSGNADIALNLDVYDASNGVTDGWFFNGDSITANCMDHANIYDEDAAHPGSYITIVAPSFGQQVNAFVGNDTPLQENAGVPGFASGDMIAYLGGWLQHVPSRYVTINLGTNDAAGGIAPAVFYANMQSLVRTVIAAGKVPVIPTIPYSLDPTHLANTPALNDQIRALYRAYPALVPGPDLWTLFLNNPTYISSDQVHPNAQGCAAYRSLWAQFAAGTFYGK